MTIHVLPQVTRPARLGSIPKLPIFLDLESKKAVLVGDGDAVAWKAELLASAGACVRVFVGHICEELQYLAQNGTDITILRRPCEVGDLDDVWLLIFGEAHSEDTGRLAATARSRGILVNVIDQRALCDFQFGTIVNRSPVVIGISTDGAAPILGQAIRRRIEAVLPMSTGAWAAAAKQFRVRLKEILSSRTARRLFWERFVDVTFISQAEEDEKLASLERLALEIAANGLPVVVGSVVIVGAGPGDPELLTLRALRELQAADVILYDRLVVPPVLELGRREARRILVGKSGHGPRCRQQDINDLMIRLAREGNRIVRLKGGDPAIFGRTDEEIDACREAGIPVSIVPGITSASASSASINLSLTNRRSAQRVQFITGHDHTGGIPDDLDFDALADPRATTVIYMGQRTASELARRIIDAGLPASTPVIIVANTSRPDQRQERMQLVDLAGDLNREQGAPAVIMIGAALQARQLP